MNEINFMSDNMIRYRHIRNIVILSLFLVISGGLLISVLFYLPNRMLSTFETRKNTLEVKYIEYEKSHKIAAIKDNGTAGAVGLINRQKQSIGKYIGDINSYLIDGIGIDNISYGASEINIKGEAGDYFLITAFEDNIEKGREYKNSRILSIEYNDERESYSFLIRIKP